MKKMNLLLGILLLLGIVTGLMTSCSTLLDVVMSTENPLSAAVESAEKKMGKALMDATGLSEMSAAMMASTLYMQVFLAGGYAGGYDDFTPGQGVVWEVRNQNDKAAEALILERAFLKTDDQGNQWWYLGYRSGEEEVKAEILLDSDYGMVKFRYQDPEDGEIREWIPETGEETEMEDDDAEAYETTEEYSEAMVSEDYETYVLKTEKITVPAGTFTTQYARVEMYDDEAEPLIYEWWMADEVPGDMVQYSWQQPSEEVSLTGKLIKITKNNATRLGSY